jgi:hypothetical protein
MYFGFNTTQGKVALQDISIVHMNHKLVKTVLIKIAAVNQTSDPRFVFQHLHPVLSNGASTLLPLVNVAGFHQHLRTIRFTHPAVGANFCMFAVFAITDPVSSKISQGGIGSDHSTTIAIVGKILCGIKTNGTITQSITVIAEPVLCAIFNYGMSQWPNTVSQCVK